MKSPRTTGNKAEPMPWDEWYEPFAIKIQNWYILSRNRVYHLYKSVPFTENRSRRAETGIKHGFQEIEREFLFEKFRPEEQDYLFRCSDAPGNFPLERPKVYLLSKQILRKLFVGKKPSFSRLKRNPRERSLWCGCPGNCRWRCAYSSESNWTKKIMII